MAAAPQYGPAGAKPVAPFMEVAVSSNDESSRTSGGAERKPRCSSKKRHGIRNGM